MSETLWADADRYLNGVLIGKDEALDHAERTSAEAGLPPIAVSRAQGKFLHLMARMIGARRILEIGALGGFSAIWLSRALPAGGKLISLELEEKHAAVARANLAHAGLAEKAEVIVGPAIETIRTLSAPFDFVFIDADKETTPDYLKECLRLVREGGVIVIDNVVRRGQVIDPRGDARVQGLRRAMEMIASEPRLSGAALQTVGDKGHDGFAVALVCAPSL
ncbi:MAG: O-methyltransferase [Hyphomonadaceae bacterium]